MPFSLLLQSEAQDDMPAAHVQGHIVHGMFFHLIERVDPALAQRIHTDNRYRPFTLSPVADGKQLSDGRGFRFLQGSTLRQGSSISFRITFLDDALYPVFSKSLLSLRVPEFRLGEGLFSITDVLVPSRKDNQWCRFQSYPKLIERASQSQHDISLHFLSPTTFGFGDVDLCLPLPRLVFQSYQRRFQEFCGMLFLDDFAEQVERWTSLSRFNHLATRLHSRKNGLLGFTGKVGFSIHKKAPPELVYQMNLLADFAIFCGTGKKTSMGMGQTLRSA